MRATIAQGNGVATEDSNPPYANLTCRPLHAAGARADGNEVQWLPFRVVGPPGQNIMPNSVV